MENNAEKGSQRKAAKTVGRAESARSMSKSKDFPLAELTIRRYERPINLTERELVRKLCLSLGLLQPGDSRDIIVDIFLVLLKHPGVGPVELREYVLDTRQALKLPIKGVAASNIRRQVRRLKELFIIEKRRNSYRVNEGATIMQLFEEKIEKYLIPSIIDRVKEYISQVDTIRKPDPDYMKEK